MRRLPLVVTALTAALVCPSAALAHQARGAACSPAGSATYRHSFGGAGGTMTVTAKQPLCAGQKQSFALVSYTVSKAGSFIFDRDTGTVTATNRSLTLDVDVPRCAAQVAGIFGTAVQNEVFGDIPYGDARPGSPGSRSSGPLAWYSSGGPGCTPSSTVTFTSACDGTYRATLANSGGVTAVFVTGDRLVRVAPGRSTTVRGAAGTTTTIRASTFTTYVGGWRRPTTGCTSAAPTTALPTTALAAPAPRPPGAAATSFPALADPTTTGDDLAAPMEPFTNPVTVATSAVAARADKGMSTGAVIAIFIGILMMAGGTVALTYLIREIRRPS